MAKRKATSKGAIERRGAYLHTEHVERTMKIYPLVESEVRSLSIINGMATFFFSLGSAAFAFCLGLYFDLAIESDPPVAAAREGTLIFYVFIPCGILFWLAALACVVVHWRTLGVVLAESGQAGAARPFWSGLFKRSTAESVTAVCSAASGSPESAP